MKRNITRVKRRLGRCSMWKRLREGTQGTEELHGEPKVCRALSHEYVRYYCTFQQVGVA